MARIPEEWKLSPSQHLEIFTNEIAPREILPHVHRQTPNPGSSITNTSNKRPPLAIIIVGQTGAGKTRLAPDLLQAMNNNLTTSSSSSSSNNNPPIPQAAGNSSSTSESEPVQVGKGIAHLIADTYKTYHPHYTTALSSSNPQLASPLTSPTARQWLKMACHLCTSHKIPVLLESACRHPDDFVQLASIFHSKGYTVLVAILAVPSALSRLGILVRYYKDLPEARSGQLPLRLTPKKVHDESYKGLEQAAEWVDTNPEGAVDAVVVVRRGGALAYTNRRRRRKTHAQHVNSSIREEEEEEVSRRWEKEQQQQPGGALRALIHERTRQLSTEELETARKDIEALEGLQHVKVDEEDIRQIGELLSSLGREQQALPELDEVFDASRFVTENYIYSDQ
ncbi:zeta toxin-domain-containing protein [Rhypophila decipiens]|uniref:Zeta toxin-domain-containing protein n=1 Tax=Rhypophila decipiens TaxID=261697 RepID=A0AAN7BBM0_9PEZI|nr:zeta toxin-domain-containing protein [Rhypophila decipiens]